jgi:HEAT repeat protein
MQEMNSQISNTIEQIAAKANLEGMKALSEALKEALPGLSAEKANAILTNLSAQMGERTVESSAKPTSTTDVVLERIQGLVDTVRDRSQHTDWRVRYDAAWALGEIKHPAAVLGLCEAVKDQKAAVVDYAVKRLRQLGDPLAVPALCEALKDWVGNEGIWDEARRALIEIGDPRAVPAFCRLLKEKDIDFLFRYKAARALIPFLKEPGVVSALIESIGDPEINNSEAVEVLRYANKNLIDRTQVQALIRVLKVKVPPGWEYHRPETRQVAAELLGHLKDPAAVPALIEALKDEVETVRCAVANALGEIKDPAAVPALIKALKDKSYSGNYAAWALGEIGDPAAIPALRWQMLSSFKNWAFAFALCDYDNWDRSSDLLEKVRDALKKIQER